MLADNYGSAYREAPGFLGIGAQPKLDHRYLNDLEPFTRINPTAENIAAYFHQELSAELNNDRIRVHAVTLWETERACVRYAEDES